MSTKFSIIGGGVMGEALLSRLISQAMYSPAEVLVSEPLTERRIFLQERYGVKVTADNREAIQATEVVLLAIKPQVFDPMVASLEPALFGAKTPPLLISIMAGVTLAKLESAFVGWPVARAMPNTPATIGVGMTAIAPGAHIQAAQQDLAKRIFGAVGEVVEVPETLMDAVTGLSGSGPGFVALVIEALTDGGVVVGLPRAIAAKLAMQTVKGTAQLLQESEMHPGQLKDQVTSPGGTTIAGIAQLERAGFRSALIEAVRAAYLRSQELGR